MNDSDYVVAFNILDSGYRQWWFPTVGLLGMTFGIVFVSVAERIKRENGGPLKVVILTLGSMWVFMTFALTYGDYRNCCQTLASGKASYVEGSVDNFVPMPVQGHANEKFTVMGVPFNYSDYEVEAGFNNASSHGGPIRQGLPVRIWYIGNEIVKLEIKK